MQRTIVGLRNNQGKYKVPKFTDCLLQFFNKNSNCMNVNCTLENGILLLEESEKGFELMHSPQCPIKIVSNSNPSEFDSETYSKICNSNIGVATSVVVESSDSHVLLTKRSAQMRSSPNVWVVPGGHVEPGETIFEAGIREVQEETGLDINNDNISILGLWENVYPLLLGAGSPKHHVLIVYIHTQLNETYEELTKKIIPNPDEVDSYCWLDSLTLEKLLKVSEDFTCERTQYCYEKDKIFEKTLDVNKMFNKRLRAEPEPFSGVNYALRTWLKKKASGNPSSKF